jgi:ribosomal protein S18 acetylase RimI-like enzyme
MEDITDRRRVAANATVGEHSSGSADRLAADRTCRARRRQTEWRRRGASANLPPVSATEITLGGADALDELEPLWRSMHAHHATLESQMGPLRSAQESWRRRRTQYQHWLADGHARLLIARREERAVGYAMVTVGPGPPTWDIGELVAELESLAVAEDQRGAGIGSLLVAAARASAHELGAQRLSVGVAHANAGALRFYAREGFAPFYLQLLDAVDPPSSPRQRGPWSKTRVSENAIPTRRLSAARAWTTVKPSAERSTQPAPRSSAQ